MTATQRWVLGLCAVAAFLSALDTLVVSTALTALRVDLGASLVDLEWVPNAYVLAVAVLMMAASTLGDRLGRRRVFTTGLVVFAASSAVCAVAPSIGWLVAGRAVQGAGAAMVLPLALTLTGAAFGPVRRGWAMGVFSSVIGFSMLCGPLVGGVVVQGLSWPWIFWVNVPVAVAVAALARLRLPESFGPTARLDVVGMVLVTGAALGVVWGVVRSASSGWLSLEVIGALVVGLAFLAAFVGYEGRTPEPMLPMRLFRLPVLSAGNLAMFCLQACVAGSIFFMAQFLQDVLGYDALHAGLGLLPWGAVTCVAPRIAGRLVHRYGARPFGAGGLAVYGACMLWIAFLARPDLPYWQLVAPLLVSGAGFGVAAPAIQAAVLGSVPHPQVGTASGTMSTIRQLGAAIGVAALAAGFAAAGGYSSPAAVSAGFAAAMAVSGSFALLGAGASLVLPGAPQPGPVSSTAEAVSSSPVGR